MRDSGIIETYPVPLPSHPMGAEREQPLHRCFNLQNVRLPLALAASRAKPSVDDSPSPGGEGWGGRSTNLFQHPFQRFNASTLQRFAGGFTLVELLVVIAVIAILAAILLPVLSRAQLRAQRIQCLSNVRQLAVAAQVYTGDNSDFYPIAQYYDDVNNISYCWDFTMYESNSRVVPGLLWQGQTNPQIQQCPSFNGSANWDGDPYTGYNYNTSYIGHGQGEATEQPAKASAARHPATTVVFGDGQWASGADKFMRAPWPDVNNGGDNSNMNNLRSSGTQGFRHSGLSNAAFCDGHAESLSACYTNYATDPYDSSPVAPGTGFLSVSNSIYDLN